MSLSLDSLPSHDDNTGTRIIGRAWALAEAPWSGERIFTTHYAILRGLCQAVEGPALVVASFYGNQVFAGHAVLRERGKTTLVLGRHAQSGLRLPDDPSVALRHVLARRTVSAGTAQLRLLDLKTGQGFGVEQHAQVEALVTDGDVCINIGRYSVLFLTVPAEKLRWPVDPREAWMQRPRAMLLDLRRQDIQPLQTGGFDREHSQITLIPGAASPAELPPHRAMPADAVASATLAQGTSQTIFPITGEQLARGVLLGRYRRCDVAAQGMWQNDCVSRVHLLIIQEGDEVLAIDTASTNGSVIDGEAVDVAVLGEQALIELTQGNMVRWRMLRGGDAAAANSAAMN